MHCLLKISSIFNAKYVTHFEDDIEIFDEAAVKECFNFLEENNDCQHVRLLKFDFENMHLFDKMSNNSNIDHSHAQRMFNQVTKEKLFWEKVEKNYNSYEFYKNNWHWNSFPSVCRTSLFEKLLPKKDSTPLMGLEREMFTRFHDLNLKTGVLNKGCAIHNQPNFSPTYSIRAADPHKIDGVSSNVISYKEVEEEINKVTAGIL